jgi:hypothetical protein
MYVELQLGLSSLHEQQYDKAIGCFEAAMKNKPAFTAAWCNLGIALQLSDRAAHGCQL